MFSALKNQNADCDVETMMHDDDVFSFDNNEGPALTRTLQDTATSVGRRICIFATGAGLGFVLFMPSVMMSDSGTDSALASAQMAMIACLLFFVGGLVGAIVDGWRAFSANADRNQTFNGLWCLLPGALCVANVSVEMRNFGDPVRCKRQ